MPTPAALQAFITKWRARPKGPMHSSSLASWAMCQMARTSNNHSKENGFFRGMRGWHWVLLLITLGMAISSVVLIIRLFCKGALDAPTAAERHALIMARIRLQDGANCATYGTGTNYYIGCQMTAPRDVDPGDAVRMSTALGGSDVVVAAFDTLGNYLWHRTLGSSGDDRMVSTFVNQGNVHVRCSFTADPVIARGTYTMPLPVPVGECIAQFDTAGALIWIRTVQDLKSDTTARWPFPPFH